MVDEPFKPTFNRAVSEKIAECGEKMLADSPRGCISIKEKLARCMTEHMGRKRQKSRRCKRQGEEESL